MLILAPSSAIEASKRDHSIRVDRNDVLSRNHKAHCSISTNLPLSRSTTNSGFPSTIPAFKQQHSASPLQRLVALELENLGQPSLRATAFNHIHTMSFDLILNTGRSVF